MNIKNKLNNNNLMKFKNNNKIYKLWIKIEIKKIKMELIIVKIKIKLKLKIKIKIIYSNKKKN